MATIDAVVTRALQHGTVVWSALAGGDVGQLIDMPGYVLESIQFTGTFGAAVTMEGTNDEAGTASLVVPLDDQGGTAVSHSAAGASFFRAGLKFLRPNAAAGVTSVTVTAHYRRT